MLGELVQLLTAHQALDVHEQMCQKRMLDVIETKEITSSQFFSPGHFTASAFVLSPDEQSVLLIFHPGFQKWIQPGGHLEKEDASIRKAALREVHEETSLDSMKLIDWIPGILDLDVHQVPASARKQQPSHEHYDVRFVFRALEEKGRASNEIKQLKWVRLDCLQALDTDASVQRGLRRIDWHRKNR